MKQEVRRGRKFVEYHDPDTQDALTFTQEISGADVSYQDEAGNWLPADENWQTDGLDGFILKNDKLNHKVRLKGTGGRTWYPRRNVNTEYMTFGVPQYWNGKRWANFGFSGWSVEGKTITLQTRENVTILVHNRWNGIKIDWVLASSSAPSRMRYPVSLTGITYVDGIIYGADGTRLGQLTPTTATDANGLELACSGVYSGGFVEFSADVTGAVYPVVIDPDFTNNSPVDTLIRINNPDTNYSSATELYTGRGSNKYQLYRSLLKFDLSSIPSGASVSASSLTVVYHAVTNAAIESAVKVYRQLRNWVDSEATWNIYSTGNSWATAGGFNSSDCEQTDIGSAAVLDVGTYQFTLTAAKVQEWISGTLSNNGVLLRDPEDTNNTFKRFHSSEYATAGDRPVLSVTYTAGSTGVPKHFLHYARLRSN